jgi:hypothetical protein
MTKPLLLVAMGGELILSAPVYTISDCTQDGRAIWASPAELTFRYLVRTLCSNSQVPLCVGTYTSPAPEQLMPAGRYEPAAAHAGDASEGAAGGMDRQAVRKLVDAAVARAESRIWSKMESHHEAALDKELATISRAVMEVRRLAPSHAAPVLQDYHGYGAVCHLGCRRLPWSENLCARRSKR